jgi:hypothetical protein
MNECRCWVCNKYFSPKEKYYVWTPFGDRTSLYQPPDEFAHKKCYENLSEKERALINKSAWIKPWEVNNT